MKHENANANDLLRIIQPTANRLTRTQQSNQGCLSATWEIGSAALDEIGGRQQDVLQCAARALKLNRNKEIRMEIMLVAIFEWQHKEKLASDHLGCFLSEFMLKIDQESADCYH